MQFMESAGFLQDLEKYGGGLAVDGRKDVLHRDNQVAFVVSPLGSLLVGTVHVPITITTIVNRHAVINS